MVLRRTLLCGVASLGVIPLSFLVWCCLVLCVSGGAAISFWVVVLFLLTWLGGAVFFFFRETRQHHPKDGKEMQHHQEEEANQHSKGTRGRTHHHPKGGGESSHTQKREDKVESIAKSGGMRRRWLIDGRWPERLLLLRRRVDTVEVSCPCSKSSGVFVHLKCEGLTVFHCSHGALWPLPRCGSCLPWCFFQFFLRRVFVSNSSDFRAVSVT